MLTILKYCRKAREDLKQMNSELSRLNFSARYEFDVHYVKDSSEYARIIEFADYLDERLSLIHISEPTRNRYKSRIPASA